jgi:hypothetical protein
MRAYIKRLKTYYNRGGLVRSLIKGTRDGIRGVTSIVTGILDVIAREHRYWNEYPLSLTDRIIGWRHGFLSRATLLLDIKNKDIEEYLSDFKQGVSVSGGINNDYTDVLENKVAFHIATSPYTNHIPEFYGTIENGQFIPNTQYGEYDSIDDIEKDIVLKPITGQKGEDIYWVHRSDDSFEINGQKISKSALTNITNGLDGFIVVEYVEQDDYAGNIWPRSTNTIRILTVLDPKTNVLFIARAVHRFGSSSTGPTDNWSGGGFVAPVDIETGEISNLYGYSFEEGIQYYEKHPESEAQVKGQIVPNWENIKESVLEVANLHRQCPYVGWDVVLTNDGPIILEGNTAPGNESLQLEDGLYKNKRVKRFFEDL